jgi:hypothetical protein
VRDSLSCRAMNVGTGVSCHTRATSRGQSRSTRVSPDHIWPQVTACTRASFEGSQAHDQPQVPPAGLRSGMAPGWSESGVTSCAGIPPRRQQTCSRPGAGVHVAQPSGAHMDPCPWPALMHIADATGYPLTHSYVVRKDAIPGRSDDLGLCPACARCLGDSRGTTDNNGENLTDCAREEFPAHSR